MPFLNPPRTSMQLSFNQQEMQTEVLKYLSVGMPIENAKRIMEDSGFTCHYLYFADNCLDCSTIYGHLGIAITDEIHVFLSHDAGKITAIRVDCRSCGM